MRSTNQACPLSFASFSGINSEFPDLNVIHSWAQGGVKPLQTWYYLPLESRLGWDVARWGKNGVDQVLPTLGTSRWGKKIMFTYSGEARGWKSNPPHFFSARFARQKDTFLSFCMKVAVKLKFIDDILPTLGTLRVGNYLPTYLGLEILGNFTYPGKGRWGKNNPPPKNHGNLGNESVHRYAQL